MAESAVLVERRGRVAVLQLNRPYQLNALSPEVMDELLDALRVVDADAPSSPSRRSRAAAWP